jgi:hypothetical protein
MDDLYSNAAVTDVDSGYEVTDERENKGEPSELAEWD